MKLTVIGCGDAFGSGGRLQTCYHVEHDDHQFLIDCGATALSTGWTPPVAARLSYRKQAI